jgi:hypothetical protein
MVSRFHRITLIFASAVPDLEQALGLPSLLYWTKDLFQRPRFIQSAYLISIWFMTCWICILVWSLARHIPICQASWPEAEHPLVPPFWISLSRASLTKGMFKRMPWEHARKASSFHLFIRFTAIHHIPTTKSDPRKWTFVSSSPASLWLQPLSPVRS